MAPQLLADFVEALAQLLQEEGVGELVLYGPDPVVVVRVSGILPVDIEAVEVELLYECHCAVDELPCVRLW